MQKEETFYNLTAEAACKSLDSTSKGLSSSQAERRLHEYGLNELQGHKGVSPFKIFIEQFTSPLVWILIGAFIVSLVLQEHIDAIVIAIIIIVNAALGFFQEYRAEKSIEALKRMTSPKAKVLRNGKEMKIESKYVVPGDILILETGDKIPADARLLEEHTFQTAEGPLTGESVPVSKSINVLQGKTALGDRKNMVFASTVVTKGRATAIVTHTAMKTEIGKIAKLISEQKQEMTPLQKKLRTLGKYMTIAVILIAVVVFFAGLIGGETASVMLLTAIALAVAAIPEGLPAVITISLAIGVQRMVKKNSLVRKLPSVETLGSVTIICSDKTGTLTHNEMTVTSMWMNGKSVGVSGSGYAPNGMFTVDGKKVKGDEFGPLLRIGTLCNDAHVAKKGNKWEVFGDPTEAALVVSARKAKIEQKMLNAQRERLDEIPFSSERKMMTTIHKVGKKKVSYTKGAPDIVIELCDRILLNGKVIRLTRAKKKEILQQNELYASKALRVLGFAYNDSFKTTKASEKGMIFVGLQAMIDPPRHEAKAAITRCHKAGMRVIMITGDHLTTAEAIARELGITGKAVTGHDIDDMKNLGAKIKEIGIFARVNPEHKLQIVNALKKKGHIVAMTGDGVNDAPALKRADIGVAMGISGTDVAKEASDMILTDDNFTSIVNAVEEGRGIFDNIRKFINYLLSSNLGEITVILCAALIGLPLPLTAIQILWVNLVTDGLPATALSLDPHSEGIMEKPPRNPKENILSKTVTKDIIIFGVLMGFAVLVLFWLYQDSSLMKAQTIAFTSLVLFELVRLQTIRMKYNVGMFSNKPLVWAVIGSIILHLGTIYTPAAAWFKTEPLALIDWGVMIVASVVLYVVYRVVMWVWQKFSK